MAIALVVNGVTYQYPQVNDTDWGPDATDWASAITSGTLQKAGGLFQLLAEVDYGSAFGVKSLYYKSRTANTAAAGQIRLARTDNVSWRNNANSADLSLTVDASDNLLFNGAPIGGFSVADTTTIDLTFAAAVLTADIANDSITNAMINSIAAIAYSKLNLSDSIVNADINASAGIVYSKLDLTDGIVNADINTSAAIARTKLASGTAYRLVTNDVSGVMSDAAAITASRALISDANGMPTHSTVTSTELGYVSGVTSSIQDQFDASFKNPSVGALDMSFFKIVNLDIPTNSNDAATKNYVDVAAEKVAPTIQKFLSGSGTYTTPTLPPPLYIQVEMVGGGGGGGGSGTTTTGGTGGAGGNTTFGTTLLSANGGGGGSTWNVGGAGAGGSASLGTGPVGVAVTGSYGVPGSNISFSSGGPGGSSAFSGSGDGATSGRVGGPGATNSGSGGGGGAMSVSGSSGGGGGSGGYVKALILSPSSDYSYAVGAAGTAGTAGTSGFAGGAGGSGIIIVTEYYQ